MKIIKKKIGQAISDICLYCWGNETFRAKTSKQFQITGFKMESFSVPAEELLTSHSNKLDR